MRLESYAHVFCSALERSLLYKTTALYRREERVGVSNYSGESAFEIEDGERVDIRFVFSIEYFALKCIPAAGNSQPAVAGERAEYTLAGAIAGSF